MDGGNSRRTLRIDLLQRTRRQGNGLKNKRDGSRKRDRSPLAAELCDKMMEAVRAEQGADSEFYAALVFAGLETEGGIH
jgi:hypothetical protein